MNRGEVWQVNLDLTVGAEIKKSRPAVLVGRDAIGVLALRIIVPLTEWRGAFDQAPWLVKISPSPENGLTKDSAADTFQVRSVSTTRLIRKLGRLAQDDMEAIKQGLAICLELD